MEAALRVVIALTTVVNSDDNRHRFDHCGQTTDDLPDSSPTASWKKMRAQVIRALSEEMKSHAGKRRVMASGLWEEILLRLRSVASGVDGAGGAVARAFFIENPDLVGEEGNVGAGSSLDEEDIPQTMAQDDLSQVHNLPGDPLFSAFNFFGCCWCRH